MTAPRSQPSVARGQYPNDNTVDIAVLYERLGFLMKKVDDGFEDLRVRENERIEFAQALDQRIASVETQINSARWFAIGLAAGGGVLGGSVVAVVSKLFGG